MLRRLLAAILTLTVAPSVALACGGGLVSRGATVMNAQRIFLSLRKNPERTEIITQVAVPRSGEDYGVLIPLPAVPVIDPTPVPAEAFDALDEATAPRILEGSSGGGGFGCMGSADKAGAPGAGVSVGPRVDIGPVTAQVLTATDGEALNAWLSASGFALDAAGRALVTEYTAPGRAFVALRRSNSTATTSASSVGVHFTLPGDQRALPMRFARLGAASSVSFVLFIIADTDSGPALPFKSLTVDDLDRGVVSRDGYAAAVERAVAAQNGKAFVVERREAIASVGLPPPLAALVDDGATLFRLTTIVAADKLITDVRLDGVINRAINRDIRLSTPIAAAALGPLALVLLGRRLRRRRINAPSDFSSAP